MSGALWDDDFEVKVEAALAKKTVADCTYLYFKSSGKWKYEGRGLFPSGDVTRESIMADNGSMPGIISDASDMIVVVIPDDGCATGFAYPRMLHPLPYHF